jgi:type I restriction enzyme S subunit
MKKRIEDTVLARIISSKNQEVDAKTLWQESGLSIDEFYATLKREIDEGFIAEPAVAKLKLVEATD